jgi:hypothetical protein
LFQNDLQKKQNWTFIWRNKESQKNPQNEKIETIENVTGTVLLSLFMDGT